MQFFTSFEVVGNDVLLSYYDGNVKKRTTLTPEPILYTPSLEDHGVYSHLGDNLRPISFPDIKSAKNHIYEMRKSGVPLFGYPRFEYSVIHELFPGFKCNFDSSLIKTLNIDIETTVKHGFPNVEDPKEEIILLACEIGGFITQFGVGPTGFTASDLKYIECSNEKELICKFFDYYVNLDTDIITGWNVNGFDMPYLYARTNRLFGKAFANKLSPWGKCQLKKGFDKKGREQYTLKMYGVQVLDYYELYQKFELSPRDSLKLDYIAYVELNDRKVDYEGSFESFYTDHWDLFVEYNAHDVRLVKKLDDKLKFIQIALSMAYAGKVNYSDVYLVTRVWDNIIANYLADKNMHVVSYTETDDDDEGYEGAFVKDTIPGIYKWVMSFDVTSLYPSLIIQYNISPETMVPKDQFVRITPDDVLNNTAKFQHAQIVADKLGASLCANGAMYYKHKQGFIPYLTDVFFNERVTAKNSMKKWEKLLMAVTSGAESEYSKEYIKEQIVIFDKQQHAIKILINSLYGALGSKYFRMYDVDHAEGITLSGQYIIHSAYKYFNNKMLELTGGNRDIVVASDTDSCYIDVSELIEQRFANKSTYEIVDIIDKIGVNIFTPGLNATFKSCADFTRAFVNRIDMKRESIANALFVKKKNYVMKAYDIEGFRPEKPKIKITGLEAVTSKIPEFFRKKLIQGYQMPFDKTQQDIYSFVKSVRAEYEFIDPNEMAGPATVNGIETYYDASKRQFRPVKTIPYNVKAAVLYNEMVLNKNMQGRHKLIKSGDKVKMVMLTLPNPTKYKYLAYPDKFPSDLIDPSFVNRDDNFNKYFIQPLERVIQVVGWQSKKVNKFV